MVVIYFAISNMGVIVEQDAAALKGFSVADGETIDKDGVVDGIGKYTDNALGMVAIENGGVGTRRCRSSSGRSPSTSSVPNAHDSPVDQYPTSNRTAPHSHHPANADTSGAVPSRLAGCRDGIRQDFYPSEWSSSPYRPVPYRF